MIPFRFVKVASMENDTGRPDPEYPDAGFNTSKDEGYGSIPVAAGAAKVPGLSVHCLSCGCKLESKPRNCPKCGSDVRRVATSPQEATRPARDDESGDTAADTGGEAAVDQDRTRGAYVGLGKYAGLKPPSMLRSAAGGAALVGAGVLAAKGLSLSKTMDQEVKRSATEELVAAGRLPEAELLKFQHFQQLEKFARHGANPILNLRLALKRARKASGNFRRLMVGKSK